MFPLEWYQVFFIFFKVGVIDFSMYLKNDIDDYRSEERYDPIIVFFVFFTIYLIHLDPLNLKWCSVLCHFHGNRNSQIASILDQKNYVEELNRQLK